MICGLFMTDTGDASLTHMTDHSPGDPMKSGGNRTLDVFVVFGEEKRVS